MASNSRMPVLISCRLSESVPVSIPQTHITDGFAAMIPARSPLTSNKPKDLSDLFFCVRSF
ncbi:hypothetical protein JOB18_006455 [Solea senegalensis]|uniref:Uncharacterized protein n=1 Tax=Solea senegalensis TaxID=28829 RepID=A0AAV6S4C6_SOLSE|nr:hypothetical protein JOB18_006455 [Solea senegalensis]